MQHLKNKNAKDKTKLEERKQKEKKISKNGHYPSPPQTQSIYIYI